MKLHTPEPYTDKEREQLLEILRTQTVSLDSLALKFSTVNKVMGIIEDIQVSGDMSEEELIAAIEEFGEPVGDIPEDLQALLAFIRGEKPEFKNPGMMSHPNGDANNRSIHEGCLRLEALGLIERHEDKGHVVVWKPANSPLPLSQQ